MMNTYTCMTGFWPLAVVICAVICTVSGHVIGDDLYEKVARMETYIQEQQHVISADRTRINHLEKQLAMLNEEKGTGVVAFHARVNGFTGSSVDDSQVPFDVVILNIGGAYNPTTGQFTAPTDGLYEFSLTFLADNSCSTNNAGMWIFVNGTGVTRACSEVYATGSSSVTVQLTAGDAVWAATDQSWSCQILSNLADDYNSFSGHLLYQIL